METKEIRHLRYVREYSEKKAEILKRQAARAATPEFKEHKRKQRATKLRFCPCGSSVPLAYHRSKCDECLATTGQRSREKRFGWAEQLKLELGCADCPPGTEWPAVALDWHHLDRQTKTATISELLNKGNKDLLEAEIEKCIVVCANHHRILEAELK